jgi:hypothetical protein
MSYCYSAQIAFGKGERNEEQNLQTTNVVKMKCNSGDCTFQMKSLPYFFQGFFITSGNVLHRNNIHHICIKERIHTSTRDSDKDRKTPSYPFSRLGQVWSIWHKKGTGMLKHFSENCLKNIRYVLGSLKPGIVS